MSPRLFGQNSPPATAIAFATTTTLCTLVGFWLGLRGMLLQELLHSLFHGIRWYTKFPKFSFKAISPQVRGDRTIELWPSVVKSGGCLFFLWLCPPSKSSTRWPWFLHCFNWLNGWPCITKKLWGRNSFFRRGNHSAAFLCFTGKDFLQSLSWNIATISILNFISLPSPRTSPSFRLTSLRRNTGDADSANLCRGKFFPPQFSGQKNYEWLVLLHWKFLGKAGILPLNNAKPLLKHWQGTLQDCWAIPIDEYHWQTTTLALGLQAIFGWHSLPKSNSNVKTKINEYHWVSSKKIPNTLKEIKTYHWLDRESTQFLKASAAFLKFHGSFSTASAVFRNLRQLVQCQWSAACQSVLV